MSPIRPRAPQRVPGDALRAVQKVDDPQPASPPDDGLGHGLLVHCPSVKAGEKRKIKRRTAIDEEVGERAGQQEDLIRQGVRRAHGQH